eukprot:3859486-Amphidinium_carterae.1
MKTNGKHSHATARQAMKTNVLQEVAMQAQGKQYRPIGTCGHDSNALQVRKLKCIWTQIS